MRATHNLSDSGESVGSCTMPHRWDEDEDAVEPRRRRRRSKLTAEERAYREARRRANLKLSFIWHFVPYVSVCVFLLFVAGFRPAFIVALAWGIGVVCHYFAAIVAPRLRHRFIEREVREQVERDVTRERHQLQGKNVASLEELSASIAHEIRNPITAAKSLVQQMEEDPTSRENTEYARVALEELQRVERSVSHLLRFARDEEMGITDVAMADVIDSALETFRDRFERSGVRVERDVAADSQLRGDPEQLRRVIINLVGNAVDAMEESGVADPTLEIASGENLAGTDLWVRIKDNSPGIPAEIRQRLFSPFHTSKANGTGLGLPICRKLVDAHGGSIEVDSQPGAGAEFLLTLPKQRREQEDTR